MAPRQSDRTLGAASNVTCDKDFDPTTKRTHAQVVERERIKEIKQSLHKEQMVTPQWHERDIGLQHA